MTDTAVKLQVCFITMLKEGEREETLNFNELNVNLQYWKHNFVIHSFSSATSENCLCLGLTFYKHFEALHTNALKTEV